LTDRELDAAGITHPRLRDDYALCRALNSRHGKTYFLATRLLPRERRPAVHALYGFARHADDIVDRRPPGAPVTETTAELAAFADELASAFRTGAVGREPVIRALTHTARTYGIDRRHFSDFMTSMRMDLEVDGYPDLAALETYMHGSAAVIGLQMVPVLGTVVPRAEAEPHAAALGVAFQLTNFIRDVGEDLDRGRVYLPADLLAAHGVDRDLLRWCRDTGRDDVRVRGALAEATAHTRGVYRRAAPGIAMLEPVARPCIETAFVLYSAILDRAEAAGFPVLHRRVSVPLPRRAAVALRGAARLAASRTSGRGTAVGRTRYEAETMPKPESRPGPEREPKPATQPEPEQSTPEPEQSTPEPEARKEPL
jgi:phytoene synthase